MEMINLIKLVSFEAFTSLYSNSHTRQIVGQLLCWCGGVYMMPFSRSACERKFIYATLPDIAAFAAFKEYIFFFLTYFYVALLHDVNLFCCCCRKRITANIHTFRRSPIIYIFIFIFFCAIIFENIKFSLNILHNFVIIGFCKFSFASVT